MSIRHLFLLAMVVLLAACGSPTPGPGEYSVAIYKADKITDEGKYVVYHLHCLFYAKAENIIGAALYEMYYWADKAETPPGCQENFSGLPLQSADTMQIGYTDLLPESVTYTYSMLYSNDGGPAAGYNYERVQKINEPPPGCPTSVNGIPLFDCTVLRKPPTK